MRIYISGKISGLPLREVKEKFEKAEVHLEELCCIPVNPLKKSGFNPDASWEHHMIEDIRLLFECDAIYMLDDWLDSRGAIIEKNIAEITGKQVFFQSRLDENWKLISKTSFVLRKVEGAIQEVTGMRLKDYAIASKQRDIYFLRLIYTHQVFNHGVKNKSLIARNLHKNHATVLRSLRKYPDEFKFNPDFREIASRVSDILKRSKVVFEK